MDDVSQCLHSLDSKSIPKLKGSIPYLLKMKKRLKRNVKAVTTYIQIYLLIPKSSRETSVQTLCVRDGERKTYNDSPHSANTDS